VISRGRSNSFWRQKLLYQTKVRFRFVILDATLHATSHPQANVASPGCCIACNAGKGAGARAAMGGLAGGFRRRDERMQQQSQQQNNAQASQQKQGASYHRAMAACHEGAAIV
jgi:hypothetical protein